MRRTMEGTPNVVGNQSFVCKIEGRVWGNLAVEAHEAL